MPGIIAGLGVGGATLLLLTPPTGAAGPILQPIDISSSFGSYPPSPLVNIINQSGLSFGYTSGVTDFDTYTALATHDAPGGSQNTGFTNTPGLPQEFTLDLGQISTIDAIAFWGFDGPGTVTLFALFADIDANFFNGTGPQLGGGFNASPLAQPQLAEVFAFGAVDTRFVHLVALNTDIGTGAFPGIGELAFRAVPEPASCVLLGAGAFVVGLRRRRVRGPSATPARDRA